MTNPSAAQLMGDLRFRQAAVREMLRELELEVATHIRAQEALQTRRLTLRDELARIDVLLGQLQA